MMNNGQKEIFPMKLYHGTSKKYLDRILELGITPRSQNGISNWKDAPSHPEMVYLTNAYPFWFSIQASAEHENIGAVMEIDTGVLEDTDFLPDEDFISQANANYNRHNQTDAIVDVHQIRKDIFGYQQYWTNSLEGLGNCCYHGIIPAEAIIRYCVIDWDKRPDLEFNYTDHCLNIEHYTIRGEFYRDVVKWFFEDNEQLPADISESMLDLELDKLPRAMEGFYKRGSTPKKLVKIQAANACFTFNAKYSES